MFKGILTALATPMKNGNVDLGALTHLVDRQIAAQIDGLVLCGSTGEGVLLQPEEKKLIVDTVVKHAAGKINVAIGVSAAATWDAVDTIKSALDNGAEGALVSAPPYVKPSQDGLYNHFAAIADRSSLPICLYNVPSRSACDILPATVARLSAHENIVALKEASGSSFRVQQVASVTRGKLNILAGRDPDTLSVLSFGGQGVICTGSNLVPEKWSSLYRHWQNGDVISAAAIQAGLVGLYEALFLESNPGPLKAGLHLLGLISDDIRSPLTWPERPTVYRIAAELENLGLKIEKIE